MDLIFVSSKLRDSLLRRRSTCIPSSMIMALEDFLMKIINSNAPRAFIHISTGVVYASPGVVKIPPCVL